MKKYYQESVKAEEKCDSAVSGPLSPVEQSKEMRTLTQELLDASEGKFLQALRAQNKSLDELRQKAHNLDKKVHHLSHTVRIFMYIYGNKCDVFILSSCVNLKKQSSECVIWKKFEGMSIFYQIL